MRRFRSVLLSAVVVGVLAAVAAPIAVAAPADLDPTFGGTGVVRQRFAPGDWGSATRVAVRADGKIVVAGVAYGPTGGDQDQMVSRFNPDGTLDTSFGNGGFVTTDYSAFGDDIVRDLALLPDGGIVTVGAADWDDDDDSTVTKYLENGTLDDTFSGDGMLRFDADLSGADIDSADRVAVAADGKIFVAGTALRGSDDDVYVRKLNTDGNPDPTFNSGNVIFWHFGNLVATSDDVAAGLILRPGGGVLIAARFDSGASTTNAALAAADSEGAPDTTFGPAGSSYQLYGTAETSAIPNDLIALPDGNFALLFTDTSAAEAKAGIAYWFPEGTALNGGFGVSGRFKIASASATTSLRPLSFVQLPDGGFLIGGYTTGAAANRDLFFARATANGQPNAAFGAGGLREIDTGVTTEAVNDVALQDGGKFLGVGSAATPIPASAQLVRLLGDYVAPPPVPPVNVALTAKLTLPSKSKLKASKLKSIAGTAEGTGLVKVKLAIQKLDPKLLKKSKRCLFVTGATGKTKKYKATKSKKCAPTKYLSAKGTTKWSYKVKLKPGKYKIFLVGVGDGARTGKTTNKTITLTK